MQQVRFHRTQIDKLTDRIYFGIFQLINMKFGMSENSAENLHAKL